MSPFLLAFEAISVTSANGLVVRFCELQCNLDVSVDFEKKMGNALSSEHHRNSNYKYLPNMARRSFPDYDLP